MKKEELKKLSVIDIIAITILFIILIIISGFITKLLWNAFLAGAGKDAVGVFTFIKPVNSILHAILVVFALDFVFSRKCMNMCYNRVV
jgi:hypothetical protein